MIAADGQLGGGGTGVDVGVAGCGGGDVGVEGAGGAIQAASGAGAGQPIAQVLTPPGAGDAAPLAGQVFDVINPGQIVTQAIEVDSASEIAFSLFWLASDTTVPVLRLTLETPSGSVIDASGPSVTYYPAAGPGFGGMMVESYSVDTPEVGAWTLQVEAIDVPPEGLSYGVAASIDSPIAINAVLDSSSYLVGSPILASVAVTDGGLPVTNATVSVLVTTPTGDVPLTLADDGLNGDKAAGDGVYSGTFTDTSGCGIYRFHVTALGQGGTFTREDILLSDLHIVGDAAGDPCLADDDGDGCTDSAELGTDETLGGLRDPLNPWDRYDVAGLSGPTPDGFIDLLFDILGVIQHYSPQGAPPYDVNFDRGPTTGPNPWNMTAPDGVIDLLNDILGVIQQYSHDCT